MRHCWGKWVFLAVILCVLIPPAVVLAQTAAENGGWLSMPDAIALLGILATIIVAVIKFAPSPTKNQQPINLTITWPEKLPEHDHPEYVQKSYCNLARENFGREISELKKNN